MSYTAFSKPTIIRNNKLVIDIGHQCPFPESLKIIQECFVVEFCKTLSITLLNHLGPKFR